MPRLRRSCCCSTSRPTTSTSPPWRCWSRPRAYGDALVVVSHDQAFLAEIGVTRWLELADGRLVEDVPGAR